MPQFYAWRVQKHIFSPKNVYKKPLLPLLLPFQAPKMQIKYRYSTKICDKVSERAAFVPLRWKKTTLFHTHTYTAMVEPFVKSSVWFRLIVILLGIPWRLSTAASWCEMLSPEDKISSNATIVNQTSNAFWFLFSIKWCSYFFSLSFHHSVNVAVLHYCPTLDMEHK